MRSPLGGSVLRRAAMVALVAGSFAGCSEPAGPSLHDRVAFDRAIAQWRARGLDSYVYRYGYFCGECPGYPNDVRITVVDGRVTSVLDSEGAPVTEVPVGTYPTVDRLFEDIRGALDRGAYRFDASYDGALGYPTELSVDYQKNAIDDEWGFSARDLQELIVGG